MTMTFARIRTLLVALALAASAAVAFAQSQAAQGAATAETSRTPSPGRPDRPAPGAASPAVGAVQASPRNQAYPLVDDARLTASPRSRYIGPPGTSSPFGSTDMTENQCTAMANCQVVQGQGPSYATWCRCGRGKLTTFTYIHD